MTIFKRLSLLTSSASFCLVHSVAGAQCENLPKQFIGAELGGARGYASGLTVRTVPFGPASNRAGIDTVSAATTSMQAQNANVHWYKDEIVAVYLTWRPRSAADLSEMKTLLLKLPGVPKAAELGLGSVLELRCAGGVIGRITFSEIVHGGSTPSQPILGLTLTHPKLATLQRELRGKDARLPGPP